VNIIKMLAYANTLYLKHYNNKNKEKVNVSQTICWVVFTFCKIKKMFQS